MLRTTTPLNSLLAALTMVLLAGSILVTNFLRGNTGRGAHAFRLNKKKQAFQEHHLS